MAGTVDKYLKNVENGCDRLDDAQLFSALIFIKKSLEGGVSMDDYLYLEEMRISLHIDDPIIFVDLLDKVKKIYYRHYFNRRKN